MPNKFSRYHYDAIVIGARCAGSATAMLMARNGARVLIVDREHEVRDTRSTHALMRPAVTLLGQWGLLNEIAAATPIVASTHFHYGDERVSVPIKPDSVAMGLYAPRRWLLDNALGQAAVAAGAELRTGTSLVHLVKDTDDRVTGAVLRHPDGTTQSVSADIVIGADGRNSMVADHVNAATIATSNERSATAYTYVEGIPNEGYRWYFGDKIAAGLIPTTNGAHCLFTSCAPDAFRSWFAKDAFSGATKILATWEPEIAADLSARGPVERMRKFPGAPGHICQCAGPGWALVGDAGYFKDPATAHGITDAFLDANRLARVLYDTSGDARAYQVERDQIAPTLFDLTNKVASLEWDFDELKSLHMKLSACMKTEQEALTYSHSAIAA
ncbi:MAG TPA: NAD(P)/FAD-dependent oxidoreductase [Octadecabacter sp.]|nr:NAD(P)/FAD-dependent oxidoreductase [Octadecabacter sp.]